MQAKAKELKRVYLDCQGFVKRDKLYFPVLILIQLMQSMVFNGVLDVPFLLTILFIGALYAFRKSYFLLFQYTVIFLAYYINLTAMLKFTYLISTKVQFIQAWFVAHGDSKFVIACKILFGIDFEAKAGGDFSATEIVYYILLLLCLFLSQAYKQCKWADVRAYTHYQVAAGQSEWAFEALNRYLVLKT